MVLYEKIVSKKRVIQNMYEEGGTAVREQPEFSSSDQIRCKFFFFCSCFVCNSVDQKSL